MNKDYLQSLAAEHNALVEAGGIAWKKLEKDGERVLEIRAIINTEAPGSYDEIALLFGGGIELDFSGIAHREHITDDTPCWCER
jgi:hypothetical protein